MNENKYRILVIDDEKDIVDLLDYNLTKYGFDVTTAFDGTEGLEKLHENPDLILLDVMMPKMDGFEFCSRVKRMNEYKDIPILFLTAKTSEIEETHGLNIGASDYIQKPVSINKIVARIKSHLRNIHRPGIIPISSEIRIGPLTIDRDKFLVTINGQEIVLVKKEFDLLFFLASNPGILFNRDRILMNVWGDDVHVIERTVDVHILNIRRKFLDYSDLIETVKGVGYRFKNI